MDRDLDRLLDLLADHPMVVVSGTKVASELGTPHSTLKDWVERLRDFGVDVEGVHGRGFRLRALPDILTERVIRQAARGTPFGARAHHYYSIGSTMDEAVRLACEGEREGAIVLAEEQTAGRGRLGRSWHSERSAGIYFSLILRPKIPAARAPVLTLAAGLAVADAVTEVTGRLPDLRWPNDVLLEGKKCCGILPEMTAEAECIRHVVLGIGLNVNQRAFPAEIAGEATSLALVAGRRLGRGEVLAALLRALDRRYRQFLEQGSPAVIADFQRLSSFASGRRIFVENQAGSFTGVTEGLDHGGFLLVRRDESGDRETVLAGKIRPA